MDGGGRILSPHPLQPGVMLMCHSRQNIAHLYSCDLSMPCRIIWLISSSSMHRITFSLYRLLSELPCGLVSVTQWQRSFGCLGGGPPHEHIRQINASPSMLTRLRAGSDCVCLVGGWKRSQTASPLFVEKRRFGTQGPQRNAGVRLLHIFLCARQVDS